MGKAKDRPAREKKKPKKDKAKKVIIKLNKDK
jgi:hypothetical protein